MMNDLFDLYSHESARERHSSNVIGGVGIVLMFCGFMYAVYAWLVGLI